MRTEERKFTRTYEETKKVFIAEDGEEFSSEEQCKIKVL